MFRKLGAQDNNNDLAEYDNNLATLGQIANEAAAAGVFTDYRERKADNTLRRQDAGLALFAEYLQERGVTAGELAHDPQAWRGITWGLAAGFMRWQLKRGYAMGSANVRLSTVKTYAKLAFKAGVLDATEYALIRSVEGYSRKEQKKVNEKREAAGVDTRIGAKKAEPVRLTYKQAKELKDRPDTPQGRRDALMMCLMLDQGLRVGEVALLTVDCFDLEAGTFEFYRPKVDKVQKHKMSADTLRAVTGYITQDVARNAGLLLQGSVKGGELTGVMSDRAITARVKYLGKKLLGIEGLSAHDLRHYWATRAAKNTPIDRLQEAGGWSSPAMPLRYIEAAKIANEGVEL